MLRRQELHDRGLDDRDKRHIAEGRHRQRREKVRCKFLRDENGGRAVRCPDDTNGCSFVERKSDDRRQQRRCENAEMSRCGKEHDIRRADQRIKFTHGADRDEDQHREKLIGYARLIKD